MTKRIPALFLAVMLCFSLQVCAETKSSLLSGEPFASIERFNPGLGYENIADGDETTKTDTWNNAIHDEDYFGYYYERKSIVDKVIFVNGPVYADGGWFEKAPEIQALVDDVWVKVSATISESYDTTGKTVEGKSYTFTFNAVMCEGIRIYGKPGGTATFISCFELYTYGVAGTQAENPDEEGDPASYKTLNPVDDPKYTVKYEGSSFEAEREGYCFITVSATPDANIIPADFLFDGEPVQTEYRFRSSETEIVVLGTFDISGKSHTVSAEGAAINYIEVTWLDDIYLWGAEFLFVAENTDESSACVAQSMQDYGELWHENNHMWWTVTKRKQSLVQEIETEKDGRYIFGITLTKAPDYGIVNIYLDDVLCLKEYDLYAPEVTRSDYVYLGAFDLTAGVHEIRVYNIDKNSLSSGWMAGIDYYELALAHDMTAPTMAPATATLKPDNTSPPVSTPDNEKKQEPDSSAVPLYIIVSAVILIAAGGVIFVLLKKNKKGKG